MEQVHAEYKRNLQNNYLIIKLEEETEEQYCLQMAENNHISGLLSFQSIRTDGELYLQYEITSRQPLEQIYEKKQMSGEELIWILSAVSNLLETMQEYLLNPVQILFDPQFIYVCAEQQMLHFCYLPEKKQENSVPILAEFLLKHLNHEDMQAVKIGYEFFQCIQEENFSLKHILKEILHKEKRYKEKIVKDNPQKKYTESEPLCNEQLYKDKTDQKQISEELHDVSKTAHKKKITWIDSLFDRIHPAVLISCLFLLVIIEILYYFKWVNLTEAGGMFFLLIFMEILINQLWKKQKNKKEEEKIPWTMGTDNDLHRILQEEMYEKNSSYGKSDNRAEKSVQQEKNKKIQRLHLIPVNGANIDEIIVEEKPVLIGKRKGESDVILDSPTVSRTHALLEQKGSLFFVCDLNSKNGTFCNGEKIQPQKMRRIEQDDRIAFAELEYRAVFMQYYSDSDSA